MGKNKNEALFDLLLGAVFVVAGILFISMKSDMAIVKIVLVADMIIGALLLISGIAGLLKGEEKEAPAQDNSWDTWEDTPAEPAPVEEQYDVSAPVAAAPVQTRSSAADLAARENELRKVVKQRRMEARQAAVDADQSAQAAADAEQALVEAEQAMKFVSTAEKNSHLAKIDRLADDAMDKSQQAAYAARRAKAAERAYKQALAEHQQAMDAAAEAMLEEEDF